MNPYHEANRRGWDTLSDHWQAGIDARGLWQNAASQPETILREQERRWLGDVAGRAVAVLGSGDNLVAFALAGLGAQVTSVDTSERQLATAAERAQKLGLEITFVRADVTDLTALDDAAFDLVYTGGHVAVWVSDLQRYYAEAVRIVRSGGLFLVSEYHPFRRLWRWGVERLELDFPYFNRGPHEYDRADESAGVPGPLPSYEFHWTVGDYVSAVLEAGCEILAVDERGDEPQEWEGAPLDGLPAILMVVGRKR